MSFSSKTASAVIVSLGALSLSCSAFALAAEDGVTGTGAAERTPGVAATNPDPEDGLDILTVTGTRPAESVPGAVTVIDYEELIEFQYTDVHRILRTVPGINLQEEDGYGLRPNIGLRGSGTDRSSKVLILEDGVPVAPAPLSAPSAYYFPNVTRMSGVEVTKGAGAVRYGPLTTAGAVQFFSTPIPDAADAFVSAWVSDLDRDTVHAWAGTRVPLGDKLEGGILIETVQDNAEGFKELEGQNTGFDIEDYVAKVGLYSVEGVAIDQELVVKYKYGTELSNETYLGLTQEDFDENPYRRYRASALDQMNADHEAFTLTYGATFSENLAFSLLAYDTSFNRNWEKLDRFDNSQLSGLDECSSLNGILTNPETCSAELEVLEGPDGYVSPDDVLGIRQNNRAYTTEGIQAALAFGTDFFGADHDFTVSIRAHQDDVDRFQEQDQYRIDNGTIVKTTDNAPGTQANRLSDAEAIGIFIEDRIRAGRWDVTAGLRYEEIETNQRRWSTPDRSLEPSSVRSNSHEVVLPSLAGSYQVNDSVSVLAGISRGFAMPGPSSRESDGTDPEESTIYEMGLRYNQGTANFSAIAYLNDYENLLAECTNSSGGSECEIGDTENAGAAEVWGLEVTAGTSFTAENGLTFPITAIYSLTETELLSSVESDIYGDVEAGDEIPYVPNHQLTLRGGIQGERWRTTASLNYVSETRDVPGQGSIPDEELIDGRTLVDVSADYQLTENVFLQVKADNIFDEEYLAARRPYGLRPGKPREFFAGLRVAF